MKAFLLSSAYQVIIILLFATCLSNALECLSCSGETPFCNSTHCSVSDCKNSTTCEGSCMLTVELHPVEQDSFFAMCFEQEMVNYTYGGGPDMATNCEQRQPGRKDQNKTIVMCLCQSDHCNSKIVLNLEVTEEPDDKENETPINAAVTIVACVVGLIFLLVIAIISRMIVVHRRKMNEKEEKRAMAGAGQSRFSADSSSLLDGGWDEIGKHSCSTYNKYSSSMTSHYSRGSKGNALNQNDQHLPIELNKTIGRGRFAEVCKAKLRQDNNTSKIISVKVFKLPNYGAWRQEREILSEKWMQHENIIEYFASEQHSLRGRLQYWLITEYYSKGNLQEFLRNNALEWNEFCDMAASIARGLAYLHDEHDLNGKEKLPVAHRDIKSCNILVKDDGVSCVLADFGLSLKLDPSLTKDELANAGQVGTSRYMAPELLERLVNLADIEMFKRVDMYAFSLVMWELATRCDVIEGMLRPYQPPFGDRITDHPTKEQILLLVCRSKQRPEIRPEWSTHTGLQRYVETMKECWDSEAEARLTASCVYERIISIRNEECIIERSLSPKEVEALNEKNETNVNETVTEISELIPTGV